MGIQKTPFRRVRNGHWILNLQYRFFSCQKTVSLVRNLSNFRQKRQTQYNSRQLIAEKAASFYEIVRTRIHFRTYTLTNQMKYYIINKTQKHLLYKQFVA